jgi:hypothetical protein
MSTSSLLARLGFLCGVLCAACTTGEPLGTTGSTAPPTGASHTPTQISVSPAAVTVRVGGKATMAAAVTDAGGQPVTGQTVTWSTANATVATVSAAGIIAGMTTGSATVSATVNGLTAATVVNVVTAATATATLTQTAQPIKGWGLYPAGGSALYSRPTIRNAIYASGLTFIRVQLDPAIYQSGSTLSDLSINAGTLLVLEQVLQEAQAQGVNHYIASIWSPPAAMKTNHSTLGTSGGQVGQLNTSDEGAFVAYVTKALLTLRNDGLPLPEALSIQNEPDFAAPYAGCVYPVAQWTRVIEAMRASFDANGLQTVALFGPETGTYGGRRVHQRLDVHAGVLRRPRVPVARQRRDVQSCGRRLCVPHVWRVSDRDPEHRACRGPQGLVDDGILGADRHDRDRVDAGHAAGAGRARHARAQ